MLADYFLAAPDPHAEELQESAEAPAKHHRFACTALGPVQLLSLGTAALEAPRGGRTGGRADGNACDVRGSFELPAHRLVGLRMSARARAPHLWRPATRAAVGTAASVDGACADAGERPSAASGGLRREMIDGRASGTCESVGSTKRPELRCHLTINTVSPHNMSL